MEQLSPTERARLEALEAHIYHWSHVAELTFQAFNVKPSARWVEGDVRDADKPTSLIETVREAKRIDVYPTDEYKRQLIIDAVLDMTTLPDEVRASFDWEDYADFVGDVVDYFDEMLEKGSRYDIVSAA
ncbi:hypothetical protein RAAC3_TM7C00001G0647 [Candidatus Saccharibacteria bacterium RAAC3_TM7_1]|nr:hypothetical protein RAAC3_TM7C00001G0647 [Candidatus Saccharibacteria bacterium RAAC3_TM7_1]HCZ28360.1 hypothetical protein [Candidatus Saccharibacteria bacterium]